MLKHNPYIERWLTTAPSIDDVREEAARCAEETAKYERGERGPLRTLLDSNPLLAEFSDDDFGGAAEVVTIVGAAMVRAGVPFRAAHAWETAAKLLREGWNRGDRLLPHVVGKEPAS